MPSTERFTPTGVGTIATSKRCSGWCTVHPHGRGDNNVERFIRHSNLGSPPRAWGQCAARSLHLSPLRFTPTGVGTMYVSERTARRLTVHPHGRGDNAREITAMLQPHGSPPRAWGQLVDRWSRG